MRGFPDLVRREIVQLPVLPRDALVDVAGKKWRQNHSFIMEAPQKILLAIDRDFPPSPNPSLERKRRSGRQSLRKEFRTIRPSLPKSRFS